MENIPLKRPVILIYNLKRQGCLLWRYPSQTKPYFPVWSELTLKRNIDGCGCVKGTEAGDHQQRQPASQSGVSLWPHGFTAGFRTSSTNQRSPRWAQFISGTGWRCRTCRGSTDGEAPMNPTHVPAKPTRSKSPASLTGNTTALCSESHVFVFHPDTSPHYELIQVLLFPLFRYFIVCWGELPRVLF